MSRDDDDFWAEVGATDASRSTVTSGESSGFGAVIAVVATLAVGAGLIALAYQLGKKSDVVDAPMIAAPAEPIKVEPTDPGGTTIANLDNDAYAMVEGAPRVRVDAAVADGVVIEGDLPIRNIDPASAVDMAEMRREIVDLTTLPTKSGLAGEPTLEAGLEPDRNADRLLAGGADPLTPDDAVNGDVLAQASQDATDAAVSAVERADAALTGTGAVIGSAATGAASAGQGALASAGDAVSGAASAAGGALSSAGNVATDLAQRAASTARETFQPSVDTRIGASSSSGGSAPVTADSFGDGLVITTLIPRAKPPVFAQSGAQPATSGAGSPRVLRPAERVALGAPAPATAQPPLPQQSGVAQAVAPTAPVSADIPPQPSGDAQIQLGALPNPDMVRAKWQQLRSAHPDLLGRLGLQVQEVNTSAGRLFRLRVGPFGGYATGCRAVRGAALSQRRLLRAAALMGARAAIFGCAGTTLSGEEAAFFREADPWGFILFARNIETPEQVAALVASLRETVGRRAPVLIDQEGGRVARLRPPQWRGWGPALSLAEAAGLDEDERCEALRLRYAVIGAELAALGVDVDCAPLLDVLLPRDGRW